MSGKADHFDSIKSLLDRLELDFYSEPMRHELAAYRRDLGLLLAALRTVKSVNVLAGRGALADRLEARTQTARASLAMMREKGEIKLRDGVRVVAWAQADPVDPETAGFLFERADLFLKVAASEIDSGEARRAAPECSR